MKYKELAEKAQKELDMRLEEIEFLKTQLACAQDNLANNMAEHMDSDDARRILRAFSNKVSNREEMVLLVRALAKIPA